MMNEEKLKRPIIGMETGTFVKSYKKQSQMGVNTITGIHLSSKGGKIIDQLVYHEETTYEG